MRPITLLNEDSQVVASAAWMATTWRERTRGWLGKAEAQPGEGILLVPASSVHSFGMRFAIDVAFLDRQNRVLKLCPALKPGRLAWGPLFQWNLQALELPQGTLARLNIKVGQTLVVRDRAEEEFRA